MSGGRAGELSREAIAAVDPQGMLGDVLAQPHQIGDALWRIESAGLKRQDLPGGLVVAGVGGSAIGAELAAAAVAGRAMRPIRAVRDYSLEPWVGPDTLVLCASYSGGTEETLACFDQATERGAPTVALTTGGALADRARAAGVPVIGVPSGMQPRAAVVYMVVATLECAALCGAAPSVRSEVEAAEALLRRVAEEWGPDAPAESPAKSLARELRGSIPIVYGLGATLAVARRWTTQLNSEGLHAFWRDLRDARHSDARAWSSRSKCPFLRVLLTDSDGGHSGSGPVLSLGSSGSGGADQPKIVQSRGSCPVERVMSAVLFADLVACYVAALSRM